MLKRSISILLLMVIVLSPMAAFGQASYIDKSNLSKGIVGINFESDRGVAVRAIKDDNSYDYILEKKVGIPLQAGNGDYTIIVLEHISGSSYRQVAREVVSLELENQNLVFLQSIQMINWNAEMKAIKRAGDLTKDAKNDMEKVEAIYDYIVENVSYDKEKAVADNLNYLPNVDEIFEMQKGICFDYSSLFAAMLRSQGIPTKLSMGYKNDISDYHSWNEVYLEDIDQWVIIDTTYDAGKKDVSMSKASDDYVKESEF